MTESYYEQAAWQRAMALATRCYGASEAFLRDDTSELAREIRRVANSIPASIAKGFGRAALNEFQRQLRVAHGSLGELETLLLLATHTGYIDGTETVDLLTMSDDVAQAIQAAFGAAAHERGHRTARIVHADGWSWISSFTPTPATHPRRSPRRRDRRGEDREGTGRRAHRNHW